MTRDQTISRHLAAARAAIDLSEQAGVDAEEMRHLRAALLALVEAIEMIR